jgi:hypothetical protein
MAFSDFTYPEVLTAFGLTSEPAFSLFEQVPPVAPSPELQNRLTIGAPLAVLLNTEKARSEGMIFPVLIEFWSRYRGRVGVYSGSIFDADPANGLSGYCDFLISRSPQQPYVTPPAVVIFEAKRDNIVDGLGQGIAGMVGAQRFNRGHNSQIDPIYGCVTSGSAWKFLQLSGNRIIIDLTEYTLAQVDRILGIFVHMVGPIPQPAAA